MEACVDREIDEVMRSAQMGEKVSLVTWGNLEDNELSHCGMTTEQRTTRSFIDTWRSDIQPGFSKNHKQTSQK